MQPVRVQLGAPGVYSADPPPPRTLLGARMDVCAFVGIAPRGPARVPFTDQEWLEAGLDPDRLRGALAETSCVEPLRPRRRSVAVPVESWDEYRRLYGAFEGPGRLPYAVAAFFEQGGRRAYVVRIVHDYAGGGDAGTSSGAFESGLRIAGVEAPVVLHARNEGAWGDRLRGDLTLSVRPLSILAPESTPAELAVRPELAQPLGTLLRLDLGAGNRVLRLVRDVTVVPRPNARGRYALLRLDVHAPGAVRAAEIVDATLELDDRDGRRERHELLGLGGAHPRRLAAVLCADSTLVYPDAAWADVDLVPVSELLRPLATGAFENGGDGYEELTPDDFFDRSWVLGDEGPAAGVHALVGNAEVSTVVVPDLYEPAPLPDLDRIVDPPNLAGPWFERCADPPAGVVALPPPPGLIGLILDPTVPADLARIVGYQEELVDLAETLRSFVLLLDVPPGLDQRRMLDWRACFDSSFAAAYHPWLDVARPDDGRDAKARINASAFAAGIVAHRERLFGVPYGPSNELAARVVALADEVSPERHAELHQAAVNVFVRERDGIRLSASRTLSLDPLLRQLSVRRLMTMLVRTLDQEMQWAVFEPNGEALHAQLRYLLGSYLRRLYRANAFAGATEAEAFFVRCDETTMTQNDLDNGRLVALVGVAPVEPLEFLVVRIARNVGGELTVEGPGG